MKTPDFIHCAVKGNKLNERHPSLHIHLRSALVGSLPLGMMDALTSAEANTIFHSHRPHHLPKQKAMTLLSFPPSISQQFCKPSRVVVLTQIALFAPTLAFSALHSLRHMQLQQYQ